MAGCSFKRQLENCKGEWPLQCALPQCKDPCLAGSVGLRPSPFAHLRTLQQLLRAVVVEEESHAELTPGPGKPAGNRHTSPRGTRSSPGRPQKQEVGLPAATLRPGPQVAGKETSTSPELQTAELPLKACEPDEMTRLKAQSRNL